VQRTLALKASTPKISLRCPALCHYTKLGQSMTWSLFAGGVDATRSEAESAGAASGDPRMNSETVAAVSIWRSICLFCAFYPCRRHVASKTYLPSPKLCTASRIAIPAPLFVCGS